MKLLSLFITLSLCINTISAQNKKLIIRNVSIVSYHVHNQWDNKDIIIDDGVISNIRSHVENDTAQYDRGAIDGTGKFIMPALSDAHVHLPAQKHLKTFFLLNLVNGVTTLRSMRGEDWHTDIDQEEELTPRLFLATPPISRRDTFSEVEVDTLVQKYKQQGFDFIKVLSVKDDIAFNNLVAASKKYDLKLAGHCPPNVGIINTCKTNQYQSIEHLGGFFQLKSIEEINSAIQIANSQKVYHCPTLDWYHILQHTTDQLRKKNSSNIVPTEWVERWEEKIKDYETSNTAKKIENDINRHKDFFKSRLHYLEYIYMQGGHLLFSPDASGIYSIPGFSVHDELKHYADAGISNFDILKIATYNLSEMLGEQNDWGAIKVGSHSDLLLLKANPLESLKNIKQLKGIVLQGKYHSKEHLESELEKSLKNK